MNEKITLLVYKQLQKLLISEEARYSKYVPIPNVHVRSVLYIDTVYAVGHDSLLQLWMLGMSRHKLNGNVALVHDASSKSNQVCIQCLYQIRSKLWTDYFHFKKYSFGLKGSRNIIENKWITLRAVFISGACNGWAPANWHPCSPCNAWRTRHNECYLNSP